MAPKQFDIYVEGLNELLRDLSKLGKEASKDLRAASKVIAERHMVPAWKNAALNYAGPWGGDIADSIRAGSDRLPKVMIGNQKKTFRGGATSNMVRYPSDTGNRGDSFAPFERTDWMEKARSYQGPAIQEWSQAVDGVVRKWAVI